jgi:2-hydroxy-6-oxonona-2,4-dienedioate hydrolase
MTLTEEGLIEVPGMSSQYVRLASGAKAHYMASGTTGSAVVLLHGGIPGSSGTAGWRFMAPFLGANGFRVYCPDMPAYGLSDSRPEYRPVGLHDHVDFIHEFTIALGLERFHLAGNSMGCANTANYVVAHPERVASFCLIAGDVGNVVEGPKPPSRVAELAGYDGTREGMRRMMEAIIHRGEAVTDDLVEMRYRAASRHAEGVMAFFPSILEYAGIKPYSDPNVAARLATKGRIENITIPGIYLFGVEDVVTPVEWGYAQEDVLPNVQFFYPEDCGHQGQTDQPELFNQVFLEFFRDGKVTRQTADAAGVSKRRAENPPLVDQV